VACGGNKTHEPIAPANPEPTPVPAVAQNPTHAPTPTPEAPFSVADSHEPEFFAPAWKMVAVGQTISFSTSVIDQDLDETVVSVKAMPATAKFDAVTQTITWTPAKDEAKKAESGKQQFTIAIDQPVRNKHVEKSFGISVVTGKAIPEPTPPAQTAVIETLLMIRQPGRLAQVNNDWPLDKLLAVGAETFKLQIPEEKRAKLKGSLDGKTSYEQMLAGLAQTHNNPRLDPKSPQFDKASFGSAADWKIVSFRPRIDKAWTELRVVYRAVKAPEPVFVMFRLRPVVEYVPALPRPEEEHEANNKIFLGMVAKHLMKNGAPNPAFMKDQNANGKAISALMTELMTFDDTKTKPYLHGFEIGLALEARSGGGSARNADGSYKSGDGWGWSAMKPFQTSEGSTQVYQNVAIPGFWTDTAPNKDKTSWVAKCAPRFNPEDSAHVPGYEILCRKTMGIVDLPATKDGKIVNGRIDANNLFFEHKKRWSVERLALEDGRRDLGEENGMTCSQCHIRNFGMHDFSDPANIDPSKGAPKAPNKALSTLNFVIIANGAQTKWEDFTLDFLHFQECRGKANLEMYIGADAAKGLTCPLAAK
jgi:hypothetical protein